MSLLKVRPQKDKWQAWYQLVRNTNFYPSGKNATHWFSIKLDKGRYKIFCLNFYMWTLLSVLLVGILPIYWYLKDLNLIPK